VSERQAGLRLLTAALRRQGVRERAETHIGGVRANPFSSADAALRRVAPASSADLRIAPAVRLASPARRLARTRPAQRGGQTPNLQHLYTLLKYGWIYIKQTQNDNLTILQNTAVFM
jgi:hypothetical protein